MFSFMQKDPSRKRAAGRAGLVVLKSAGGLCGSAKGGVVGLLVQVDDSG
jgi:hypothetical protein